MKGWGVVWMWMMSRSLPAADGGGFSLLSASECAPGGKAGGGYVGSLGHGGSDGRRSLRTLRLGRLAASLVVRVGVTRGQGPDFFSPLFQTNLCADARQIT